MSDARPPTDLRQPPKTAAVEDIPFHDPEGAKRNLDHATQRISPPLASTLPALLAESPDPDSALILFDRLVSEASQEVVRLLDRHNFLAHYAIVIFGHSRWLGETLIRNTDLLQSFIREKSLDRSFSRDEFHEAWARFRSRSFESDVSLLLARFKRREYVRIMLRDVLQIAPLAETTAEISALADVLIEEALREAENHLQRSHEPPQHMDAEGRLVNTPFCILSLGKLGGNELNYSSDLDLMFIFGNGEEAPNVAMSSREYFIRLSQEVTDILSRPTREGAVFRIDMRLRPQGGEGELATSLSHALRYYASTAHDWEQQALIKVRHSAGDAALAREFIRGVQAQVYTKDVNFTAIETALAALDKMRRRRSHRGELESAAQTVNVKLDRGGIRDVEFLVQCLQRVYGGAEPWLRSRGTLFSLQKLHDKGHISGKEFHELTNAYEFLRHLEHRLQLRQGQQTHRLPIDAHELRAIERSMEPYSGAGLAPQQLADALRERMSAVAEIYDRIIHQQQSRKESGAAGFELRSRVQPGTVHSNQQIVERLAEDAPAIHRLATNQDLDSHAHRNLFRFLSAAFTTSERYAALLRHSDAVCQALPLFESSDFLTDILIRYPEEIATLAELQEVHARTGSLHLFESPLGQARGLSDPIFAYVAKASTSYGDRLSVLRRHYRHRIFAAGARDITDVRNIYESLAITTAAAEDAITAAFGIAGEPEGMGVLALGRLGSGEFDVLSDADVLFVCEEPADRQAMTKSAEQIMQILAAYTRDGTVFPVDARLRPRGAEGELLVSPTQLTAYFKREAQPWEALMYTKLRFLAGSRSVADRTLAAQRILFERFAASANLADEAREMRIKLETPAESNLKTSAGMTYDIDFLSSFLLVKRGISDKSGTVRDRLWRCAAMGVLDKADAAVLDHAAELFRTTEHVVRLTVGRALKWLPPTEHARRVTERLTAEMLGRSSPEGLEEELLSTAKRVREIYKRVMG